MSAAPNQFEMLGREKKCRALASYLFTEFIKVVEAMDEATWAASAERAPEVKHPPSSQSRARVVEILKGVHFV